MAERHPVSSQNQRSPRPTITYSTSNSPFLRKLQRHAPNSTRLFGFLAVLISSSIVVLLTSLTATASVMGLAFLTPLIVLSSPIWVPIGSILFLTTAGFVSLCGFSVAAVGGMSWIYRYFKGLHPPGSDQIDSARSRIYDTASHVKDCAREYGEYLQSKVRDAAPGA